MPTAYSYLRFSSKKQEQGDSLKRQKAERDKWLKANPEYTLAPEDFNIQDLAVSAFKTKKPKKNAHTHPLDALLAGSNLDPASGNLGVFLALAESPDSPIQQGDILILETLDRFSRLPAAYALSAFTRLLTAGLNVLLLTPFPNLVTLDTIKRTDEIVMLIVRMQASYEYSLSIQRRVSEAWKRKRERARTGTPITKKLPAWMRYNEASRTIELVDGPAKAIQHIFQRTIDGVGQNKLVREMNEKFPPFTHKKNNEHPKWNTSYISKILSDPATYGTYQPYAFDENHERKPDGPPISGYYPQAVSEQTFNAAQYSKSLRKRDKQTKDTFVNVLEGLTTNLIDGSVCHIQTLRQKLTTGETYLQRRLQSYKHRCGVKGSCPLTVDYFPIERLVLQALSELSEESLVSKQTPKEEKAQLEKATAGLLDQIRQTEDELRISRLPRQITALANLLEQQERTLSTYQTRLKAITPLPDDSPPDPLKELKSLVQLLSEKPNYEAIQLLKAVKPKARSLIKAIFIYPVKQSNRRVYADIFLRLANNEGRHILYCPRKDFPKELQHMQILDENDVPVISITPDGIIAYSRRHKGQREEWSHKPAKVIGLVKGANKADAMVTLPLERPMRSAIGYFELYRQRLGIDKETFNNALDAIEDAPLANIPPADTEA